jgi:hypothetical protein
MKLSRDQMIQLYTARAVGIPIDEEFGYLTITPDGIELNHKKEALVQVVRHVTPYQTITYFIPLASVAALLLQGSEKYLLGRELADSADPQELLKSAAGGNERVKAPLGRVFVKDDTEILVQTVAPMQAAEIKAIPEKLMFPTAEAPPGPQPTEPPKPKAEVTGDPYC